MTRTHAVVIGLATMLVTTPTPAHADRPDREQLQAPRGQDPQGPRAQDEIQAPHRSDRSTVPLNTAREDER